MEIFSKTVNSIDVGLVVQKVIDEKKLILNLNIFSQ